MSVSSESRKVATQCADCPPALGPACGTLRAIAVPTALCLSSGFTECSHINHLIIVFYVLEIFMLSSYNYMWSINATKQEARDCYLHLTKKETGAQTLVTYLRSYVLATKADPEQMFRFLGLWSFLQKACFGREARCLTSDLWPHKILSTFCSGPKREPGSRRECRGQTASPLPLCIASRAPRCHLQGGTFWKEVLIPNLFQKRYRKNMIVLLWLLRLSQHRYELSREKETSTWKNRGCLEKYKKRQKAKNSG